MTFRSCTLYPGLSALSDVALAEARKSVNVALRSDPENSDLREAQTLIYKEESERWDNGGKQKVAEAIRNMYRSQGC